MDLLVFDVFSLFSLLSMLFIVAKGWGITDMVWWREYMRWRSKHNLSNWRS